MRQMKGNTFKAEDMKKERDLLRNSDYNCWIQKFRIELTQVQGDM